MALAGAYTAVVGDEGSVFHNPAGLAPIRRLAIGASHERAFFDGSLTTGAAALRVGRFTVGLGLAYLDFGSDSVVVPDPTFGGDRGVATGELLSAYHALAVGALTYRRGVISFGASAKYLRESVEAGSAGASTVSGLAADVGVATAVFDIAALGVVVQNLGGELQARGRGSTCQAQCRFPLPRTTRGGLTLNFVDPQGTLRLLTAFDWVAPPSGDSYVAIGLEAGAVSRGVGALGRIGFQPGRADSDRRDVVYGAGLVVRGLRIDYAYQAYDVTGVESHRFGFRWAP
jgi:hypothetical protein